MTDIVQQSEKSALEASGDSRRDDNSAPNRVLPDEKGPGAVGVELSHIKKHLNDLLGDKTITREEHDLIRLYYTREREKLQSKLGVLGEAEKVKVIEAAVEQARQDLDFAQSEDGRREAREKSQSRHAVNATESGTKNPEEVSPVWGNPEDGEIRKAASRYSLAAESLLKARSELQKASTALEYLSRDDPKWKQQKVLARSWELSRKWQAITPDELQPAVEAIRHQIEHYGFWQSEQSAMKLCYAALHPRASTDAGRSDTEGLAPYKRFLSVLLGGHIGARFLEFDQPAPVIFKSYLDVLEAALKAIIRKGFQQMFEIAMARADVLGMHPVEWTKRQLDILVDAEKFGIRLWIKHVCDRPDHVNAASIEESLFEGNWRAPRLIHMQPAGNTPYDPSSAWKREELTRSEELLEARCQHTNDFLRLEVGELTRVAHVEFVKQGGAKPQISQSVPFPTKLPNLPPIGGTSAPELWRGLHDRFRTLVEEELTLAHQNSGDRWLRARVDYKDKTKACGQWDLSESIHENFRERFEVEATRAAIALGVRLTEEPLTLWLHHLFSDLLRHKSKLLSGTTEEGGVIVRVCEASAIYCARLEKQALIEARKRPDEADVQSQAVDSAPADGRIGKQDFTPSDLRNETLRAAVIRKVQSPRLYTLLTITEAAAYFEVTPHTIYKWTDKGDLRRGTRRGSITIESIVRLERRRSRKR